MVTVGKAGPGWGDAVNAGKKIGGDYSAVAQQFLASATSQMIKLSLKARKSGEPGDLTIGLFSDDNGFPNQLLDSAKIDRRTIGGDYQWITGWLSKQPAVSVGLSYWIVVSANDVNNNDYYEIGVDGGAGYSGGVLKVRQTSGVWVQQAFDMPFRLSEPAAAHQHAAGTAVLKLGVDHPMIAQKVSPGSALTLTSVALKLAKVGQPGNIAVDICKNINGFPDAVLGTATIYANAVGASAGFVTGALDKPLMLVPSQDGYFLVVKANGTSAISWF